MEIKKILVNYKNRKSQSEAVGLVVIILIVVVVGVIFLGIYLRKGKGVYKESAEIENFLGASLDFTTDCFVSYEGDYRSLEDIVVLCYSDAKCLDGRRACDVVEENYNPMLKIIKPAGTIDFARLRFFYSQFKENDTQQNLGNPFEEIVYSEKSNLSLKCGSKFVGGTRQISASGGTIEARLELCFRD